MPTLLNVLIFSPPGCSSLCPMSHLYVMFPGDQSQVVLFYVPSLLNVPSLHRQIFQLCLAPLAVVDRFSPPGVSALSSTSSVVCRFSPRIPLLVRLSDDDDRGGAVPVCGHASQGGHPGSNPHHDRLHRGYSAVPAFAVHHLPL